MTRRPRTHLGRLVSPLVRARPGDRAWSRFTFNWARIGERYVRDSVAIGRGVAHVVSVSHGSGPVGGSYRVQCQPRESRWDVFGRRFRVTSGVPTCLECIARRTS